MIFRKLFPMVTLVANLAGSPGLAQPQPAAQPGSDLTAAERTIEQNRRVAPSWDAPSRPLVPPPSGGPGPVAARR